MVKVLAIKLAVFLCLLSFSACSQDVSTEIIGVWQADSPLESSGWPDAYQFYLDGTFKFNFSQYDGAKRILRLIGTYRIETDTIYLRIDFTVEAIGGYLTRSTITTLSDSWELEDFEVQKIRQVGGDEERIAIDSCQEQHSKKCLTFDKRKYFKMSDDPDAYK